MNLEVLKPSRRAPKVGDIFAMKPPDGQYLYGRVISTNANPLGVGGAILIYVYRARSGMKEVVPDLLRGQLLVPPIMTNKQPWLKGYFELVDNRPVTLIDRLPQHCFRSIRGWYLDELGNRLPDAIEPVGQFA